MINLLFELLFEIPVLRFILIAVGPALLLLNYVRKKDAVEAEPPKLIWSLVGLGSVSTAIAYGLEAGGLALLGLLFTEETLFYRIVHWIVAVGLMEELSKYLMLRLRTWKDPNFNCLFDGMVYAVAVSAGFALAENIMYGIRYGTSVLLLRAVVSIPAHLCFSVFMGTWYSAAKRFSVSGAEQAAKKCLMLSVATSALAHGLFDLLADYAGSTPMLLLLAVYVIAMFIFCWRRVKSLAERDAYLTGSQGGDIVEKPGPAAVPVPIPAKWDAYRPVRPAGSAAEEPAPIAGLVPTLPENLPPSRRDSGD